MTRAIDSIATLEGVVGKTPGAMHLKVIDHLDPGALRWITASPLMFACVGDNAGVGVTLAGGPPGFANGDAQELRLPLGALDDPALARRGAAFGGLFLLPGIGETLRVNGRVTGIGPDEIHVAVEECYGHCAKALIRSQLWTAAPTDDIPDDPAAFVAASRFLALATLGPDGRADLSPKGDPAGSMAQLDGKALWFADRPGNRRIDSFRNIVGQPWVALALLIPGAVSIAIVQGTAALTADIAARARFTVQDKTPQLAIRVDADSIEVRPSQALERARIWPVADKPEIDPAGLFVEHIKQNRAKGLGAAIASAALAVPGVPGLLKKGIEKDYRDNLY